MTEQIKTYFENLRENAENDAKKQSRGTLEAYWTYEFNLNHNSSEFECNELPWTTDMSDFVKTMREALPLHLHVLLPVLPVRVQAAFQAVCRFPHNHSGHRFCLMR